MPSTDVFTRSGDDIFTKMPYDVAGELEGSSSVLEYEKLLIGMIPPDERILLLERKRSPNFNGMIEQLDFNGNKYLEGTSQHFEHFELSTSFRLLIIKIIHLDLRNGILDYSIDYTMTATFAPRENEEIFHALTFKNHKTYLGLPQLKAYDEINLYFQFRTLEPNGNAKGNLSL